MKQTETITAFLLGDLEEEVYVRPPARNPELMNWDKTLDWRLKKSLYGLKQSPRVWNQILHQYLKSIGMIQSRADPCVYYRLDQNKQLILALHVYVDDNSYFGVTETENTLKKIINIHSRRK